jgi:two-component sensor histidine kinase
MLAGVYDRMIQAEITGRVPALAFVEDVVSPYRTSSVVIDVTAPAHVTLPSSVAGPVGVLVNEAVANSCRHAFPARCGRIEVTLRRRAPDRLELTIADNGVGWTAPTDRPSPGLKLMRLLARQLGGEMRTCDRAGGGAQVVVDLPAQSEPQAAGGAKSEDIAAAPGRLLR